MIPLFAAIEIKLILMVGFLVASAISSWMKKRKETEGHQDLPAPAPRPRHASVPPPVQSEQKQVSWEEELRRLLQGEQAEPAPVPPPIIVHETRRTVPPPLVRPEPEPEPEPVHRHRSVFEVEEQPSPMDVDVQPRFQPLPELTESVQAYQQASQLDHTVEAHLRSVTQRPVGSTSVQHKGIAPEAAVAVAMLRNPRSARTAILTSLILGPPRALAD